MSLFALTDSQRYLQQCEASRIALAHHCLQILQQAFNQFWADPIANAAHLGTKAAAAFGFHAKLGQFIATVAPELIPHLPNADANGWTKVWNADGSLTVIPPQEAVAS